MSTSKQQMPRVALLIGVALPIIAHSGQLNAQSVSGFVTERQSQARVVGANVILVDGGKHPKSVTQSDSAGRYHIMAPSAGTYSIIANGRGLASTQTAEISLTTGEDGKMDIQLSLAVSTLATVVVTGGKRIVNASPANSHKYDLFLLRKNLGIGTFITREQIEAKPTAETAQIFQSIPGLKVQQQGTRWLIHSQRCPHKVETRTVEMTMDADDPALYPILFIDGFRVRGLSALNDINPKQIEGIEVYQGAAQLPAEAKGNACAAIFVWLKSGVN